MTDGIFNPYAKKKKNFISPINNDNPLETELAIKEEPSVTLQTGKVSIKLNIDNVDGIGNKIGELINELQVKHPEHLLQYGVNLIPLKSTYQCDKDEVILKTKYGYVSVFIGNINTDKKDDDTDKAFQRIGYMLYMLNNPILLQKLGVSVIMKG